MSFGGSLFFWEGYPFSLGGGGGGGGGRRDLSLVSISFGGYYVFGRGVHFIWAGVVLLLEGWAISWG